MFTIIQQGMDGTSGNTDSTFYTLQLAGKDIEHFTSLEAAAMGLESLKYELQEAWESEQQSQRKGS
jgi:hypothetical protein